MLWPSIYLRSEMTSFPPKSAGMKASLRAYSIGPIIVPTPGEVLCRYCHSSWSNIPKLAYANWGYRFAILARVRTQWAHASTLGHTHAYSSSLVPNYPPRYSLTSTQSSINPDQSNFRLAASSSSRLSAINRNLDGLWSYPWSAPRYISRSSCAALRLDNPSNSASLA